MGDETVDDVGKRPVCREAEGAGPLVVDASRPARHDALDGRIGGKLHPIPGRLATGPGEGLSISPTVTLMPGRLMLRASPVAGSLAASRKFATTVAGLESQRRRSGLTGQMALSPCSGSRMMLLTKEEAARFGLPGRTQMVGRRNTRPSTKPLRL